jgi:Rnl2 family RNA ligase
MKYPSLVNHYMEKDIERLKEIYWDKLTETDWIIQEKLDGANVSLLFQRGVPVKYFSRNQEVGNSVDGTDFYGASEAFETAVQKLFKIQGFVDRTGRSIRIYGELIGPTIQRKVNYGPNKHILFYDLMQNDMHRTSQDFENFMYDIGCGALCVPKLGIEPTFEDAVAYDTVFDSLVLKKKDNTVEGVVIKPWNQIFEDCNGSLFYIKKKNESESKPKKAKTPTNYSEEVNTWRDKFLSYIHPERCASVFSKEGMIESIKDMGKYISLIHVDALETFLKEEKDYSEEMFTKQERKYILNSSKEVVSLLKTYL